MIPLILLGAAACNGEEQTVTVTVATSEFVGWDDGSTTETGGKTFTVTEGSDIEIEGALDDLILTVDEISDSEVTFSFDAVMAEGATGGGNDLIYGITVKDGEDVEFSTPTEDAVSIYRISVVYEN